MATNGKLHSIAFGGVFPNITEPILDDESSIKCQNLPPKKGSLHTKIDEFLLTRIGSPKNGFFLDTRFFLPNVASRWYAVLEKDPLDHCLQMVFRDLGPYRDPFPKLGPYRVPFLPPYTYIFQSTPNNAKMGLKLMIIETIHGPTHSKSFK